MTDFLSRLAARAQGSLSLVKPLVTSMSAPTIPAVVGGAGTGPRPDRLEHGATPAVHHGYPTESASDGGLEVTLEAWDTAPVGNAPITTRQRERRPPAPGRPTPRARGARPGVGATEQGTVRGIEDPARPVPQDDLEIHEGLEPAVRTTVPVDNTLPEQASRTERSSAPRGEFPRLPGPEPVGPTLRRSLEAIGQADPGVKPAHPASPSIEAQPGRAPSRPIASSDAATAWGDRPVPRLMAAGEPGLEVDLEGVPDQRAPTPARPVRAPMSATSLEAGREARAEGAPRSQGVSRSGVGLDPDAARGRAFPAEPPVVKVTIGRIEVRAVTPPTPVQLQAPRPAPVRARPALSLDAYLKSRGGRSR